MGAHWHSRSALSIHDVWIKYLTLQSVMSFAHIIVVISNIEIFWCKSTVKLLTGMYEV